MVARASQPSDLSADTLQREILITLRETRDTMQRIENILKDAASTVSAPPPQVK